MRSWRATSRSPCSVSCRGRRRSPVRDFVSEQFVARGMIADLNVHWGQTAEGEAQPHAHVMLTMRSVGADGFGPKMREWNAVSQLTEWRERWAELANERLCALGQDARIDHRSYAEQGIGLEPHGGCWGAVWPGSPRWRCCGGWRAVPCCVGRRRDRRGTGAEGRAQAQVADLKASQDAFEKAGMLGRIRSLRGAKPALIAADESAGPFGEHSEYRVIQGY